jgi:WD40 repeat protein
VRRNRPQVVAAVLGLLVLVALLAGLARQQKLKAEKAQTELLLQAESVAHREAETARQAAETARAAEQEQRKKAETYLYYNKIVLAEREWTAGNIDRVKELLQQCPQNARGWEWRYLDQMCRRELAVVQGPDEVIYGSMAFSPDGKWVVSGGDSETVRFWDSTSGKVTHELGEKFWSDLLAVSPDARLVVSVGWYPWTPTQTVKLWDAATGKEIQELKRTNLADKRKGIATFSPDGQWLALAIVEDRSGKPVPVTLWDVRARPLKLVHTLKTAARWPVHMAFSPDSRRLAYVAITPEFGVRVRELKTWKTETGEALLSVEDLPFVPGEVVFSPDGKQLALTADDRAVHVLDAETGKERRALRADSASPKDVAYRPDGTLIASCGLDGIVQLWDPVRLQCVRTLRGGTGGLADLAFSADGRRLMTCSFQNRMAVWDPDTGQDPFTLQVKGTPFKVAVSPDGGRLACGTWTGPVSIWDPTTGQLLLTLHGHDSMVLGLAFSPDGSLLASSDESHRAVELWDPTTGQLRRTLTDEGPVYRVTFSPDGQYLATCFQFTNMQNELSAKVNLWSVSAGQRVRTLPGHTKTILDMAFSPDGARLVSAGADHTARVWDVKTGRELVCFRGHGQRVYEAKFSPDGRRIASASADKTVNVWDADTGAVIHTLRGHNDRTYSVAFSRDGRRIASCSADGTIKVWDATSGDERLTLRNPGVGVPFGSVVFGPEDQWLASSSSGDQTIRLWEATPLTPERRLQRDAATLVNDLPTGLGFKGEMLAYLRTLPSVSEPLREHALSMAEQLQEDPWRLNRASYLAVRQPGRDAAKYRLALRQSEAARDLAHPGFYFNPYCPATTSIGIAHYRLGEYREAVEALSASEAYYHTAASSKYAPGTPWTLAFLVMAHHRLGEQKTAQAILAQLHKVMKDNSEWAADGELQAYVREAEELSWWGSPALTEEERRLRHEAATVVNDLPDALGFKDEILAYLRTLDSLSEPVRQHALTIAERLPEDPWRLHRAALHYQAARKFDRALRLFEESLALRKARLGPDHPDTLSSMKYLANAYRALGMHDRELSVCRELADLWKRKAGADSSQYLGFLAALSVPLLQLKEWTEAEIVLRKVLTDSETKNPGAWQTFYWKAMLGGALLGQERYAAAEPLLRAGYEGMKRREGTIPQRYKIRLAEALDRLIALAEATNRPEDVRMWKDEKTKLSRDSAPKPEAENP